MTKLHGWPPILILFGIALLGSVVHCSQLTGVRWWGDALPSLYYLPIVIAAITMGMRAAVSVGLASGLAHTVASAFGRQDPWIGPFTETMLYVGVGLAAAKISQMQKSLAAAPQGLPKGPAGERLEKAYQGAREERQIPAVSQIVAGLIDRFREPLSSIEGAVWLLRDRRFPDEKRAEFVRIIEKESRQLDRALADVLDFTQPRRPRRQKVNLSQLVDQVIQRAEPKEHGSNFLFVKEIPPTLPVLTCDPDEIGKMLHNLILNSIQATPGGGQIAIAAQALDDAVLITVRDQGRGIPPTIVGRIFDPFFTTRDNALGLGLTVARQIAAAHCGTIAVSESSEKGTCISVRVPLSPPDPDEYRAHISGGR